MATLCVLAAGLGSRYGGFKQIDSIGKNGAWLLDYAVFDALRVGFSKIVFVVNEGVRKEISSHIHTRWSRAASIHYVTQHAPESPRTKPWGTAHATYSAYTHIREPFALINADDFYGPEAYHTLYKFLTEHTLQDPKQWAMIGYSLGHTLSKTGSVSRGICQVDQRGNLEHITEVSGLIRRNEEIVDETLTRFSEESIVSMNCWAFAPTLFPFLEEAWHQFYEHYKHDARAECYLPQVVEQANRQKLASVQVLPVGKQWMGVTYAEDKMYLQAQLEELHTHSIYPQMIDYKSLTKVIKG